METEDSFVVDAAPIAEGEFDEREGEVLMRAVTSEFEQYVKLNSKIPPEVLTSLSGIEDPRPTCGHDRGTSDTAQ